MGKIIWLTGQPGSGKTTLAKGVVSNYDYLGKKVFHIDGDNLRDITENYDYTAEGRYKNVTNAQFIAKVLSKSGYVVVVSLVSPYKIVRGNLKNHIENYYEIYVTYDNTIERGREHYHVEDYEEPVEDFLYIDTTTRPPGFAIDDIMEYTDGIS